MNIRAARYTPLERWNGDIPHTVSLTTREERITAALYTVSDREARYNPAEREMEIRHIH